ncbi:molybdopterin-dependent oxidoreductase [Roseateles paludis]|uniref:Molybdopterin-dependent oxidoreductase n=1 Tax=Roseateles paludis TaxID=3145238 RepID=A0ABV0G226_9BURK
MPSHYRICPLCEACCGLELKTDGERVISIRGAEHDVFSHGYLCPKAVALKDLHQDPDRLRTPLIRRDGQLVPASWDEAFAEIEARLLPLRQAHGPDAVAITLGNPVVHKAGLMLYGPRLVKALGTRNVFSASTLDQMPKQLASGLMFGHWMSVAVPDIERCELLVILGANPMVSNGSMWTVPDYRGKAKALRARGGRIVVIDPRRTETAEAADEHLAIRPGGDVYLLLGIAHTLFTEGLVQPGRLSEHLQGLDAAREAIAPWPPERTAAGCGIAAATQRRLARELAASPRAALYGRIGTCTQRWGTVNSWLIDLINVLTGQLDREGGMMFPKAAAFAANTQGHPGQGRGVQTGRRVSRVSGAPEVMGELPMTCLAEEITTPGPGQVRALITVASNPVLSAPGSAQLDAALAGLDFMLSLDIYVNETTRHADVILPGLSPLEDLHFDPAFAQLSHRNHARVSGPVFEPTQPPEWQTLLRLVALLEGRGLEADIGLLDDELLAADLQRSAGPQAAALMQALQPLRGPERLIDLQLRTGPYEGLTLAKVQAQSTLEQGGIDLGPLQPRIPELLRTESGNIELAPPAIVADLARLEAPTPAPPFSLIGRRDVRSSNSWLHNLPVLAKGPERCTLHIHPEDAAALGLGDYAELASATGRVTARIERADQMARGVVSLPHGWGHHLAGSQLAVAAERPGANLNAVLSTDARDPLSGNAVLSGIEVSLRAVPPPSP